MAVKQDMHYKLPVLNSSVDLIIKIRKPFILF